MILTNERCWCGHSVKSHRGWVAGVILSWSQLGACRVLYCPCATPKLAYQESRLRGETAMGEALRDKNIESETP